MQETRLFNPETGETVGMRSKEHAHDYRYFPEPDLVPLRISEAWMADIRKAMPELPAARRARFIENFGLREYDAQVLTATRAMSDYFEKVAAASGDPRTAANWVMGDLAGLLKAENKEIEESPVSAENLGRLVALIGQEPSAARLAKEIFRRCSRRRIAGNHHGARRPHADQR
jgi:aspartyl-tRNA(Asn)/glutamyl-tRNA(Gln) amidotransferase subunit B